MPKFMTNGPIFLLALPNSSKTNSRLAVTIMNIFLSLTWQVCEVKRILIPSNLYSLWRDFSRSGICSRIVLRSVSVNSLQFLPGEITAMPDWPA